MRVATLTVLRVTVNKKANSAPPTPLGVRGYGAGGEVTAQGALADLLKVVV